MTATVQAPPLPLGTVAAPRAPRGTPRLAVLDGLRLLAAVSVLCYHYVAIDTGWGRPTSQVFPTAHLAAAYGWLGVQLFFLISGFVICMTAWGRGPGEFLVSRVTRLYPAYWFAVLLTASVLAAWPMTHPRRGLSDVLTNLTMLNEPLGVRHVDGVYWTLWVELRFYLLFGLVVWRGLTYRRAVLFCALWTVASVVAERAHEPLLTIVVDPQYSAYFVAGIACYLMYRFGRSILLWGLIGVSFLLAQHQIWVTHQNVAKSLGHPLPAWPVTVILAGCFLVIIAVASGVVSRVRWRWLTVAGALTYPLYLLHAEIGWVVIRGLRDALPPGLLVAGLAVAMGLLAWLVHRLVERPLAPPLRRALRRGLEQARAAG